MYCIFHSIDNPTLITEQEQKFLETEGYIAASVNTLHLTAKGESLFQANGFEELWKTYPATVRGKDGNIRRIRTDREICENIYKLTVKSNEQHTLIMKCLDAEIEERKRNDSLGFMVELPRYLRRKRWTVYIDSITEKKEEASPIYGQEEL